jgi:sugar phosphate isomerase/epimerase
MELAAQTGGDRGVEIVGVMDHRCWPGLSREFERVFKSSVARWQLIPTHYDAYADMTVYPNLDDRFQFHVTQLETAKRLGFPLVRIQSPGADPIVEKLTRVAEKMKLKLAIEIHTPLMFENPECQALIEMVKKVSSESLGLLPDCSIFEDMAGVRQAQGTVAGAGQKTEYPPSDPAKLAGIMPLIMGIHGKFHRVVNGEIPEVPFAKIAKVLTEGGFKGWMSTEFEGGVLGDYPNSFEVVKAHHALMKRLLAQSAA